MNPDMEALLRRAAAAYPVKPGIDRWEEIAEKLSPHAAPPQRKASIRQVKKVSIFLLLFLFGFLVIQNKELVNKNQSYFTGNTHTRQLLNTVQGKTANHEKLPSITDQLLPNDFNSSFSRQYQPGIPSASTGFIKKENYPNKQHQPIKPPARSYENREPVNSLLAFENAAPPPLEIPAGALMKRDHLFDGNITTNFYQLLPASTQPIGLPKTSNPRKGFYFGITGGFTVNAIKDQGFDYTGFRTGMLAGYRFNTVLSLESGVRFSRKNYHTAGRYFNMDEMHKNAPAVTEVTKLQGSSQLFELPVLVRYDAWRKPGYRIFSTLGISSYLLTKETNRYDVIQNGSAQKMYATYKKDKVYTAAAIDLSIGFEKALNNRTNHVRVEPYLQLPLNGTGVGLLPIKTAGISIGITLGP